MRFPLLIGAVLLVASTPAPAMDVPVAGRLVKLSVREGRPDAARLRFRSEPAPGVAAPLPDPTLAGATLSLFDSRAPGYCAAEIALPAAGWAPLRGDGARRGWRYRDPSGSAGGIRKVVLKPGGKRGGKLRVDGRGANLPCGLGEGVRAPFLVDLVVEQTRYCAEFGGSWKRNQPGDLHAAKAAAPARCAASDVTVANLNLLHGLGCADGEGCRQLDRVGLLGEWLVERGCPAVVALQEINAVGPPLALESIDSILGVCPVPYQKLHGETPRPVDDSLLLTRHGVLDSEVVLLHGDFRSLLWARLDHPRGVFDLVSTHLASGADAGSSACDSAIPCPAACVLAGAATIRDCQAVQVAEFLEARLDHDEPAFVVGDFNAEPGSYVHDVYTGRGWLDATAEAGNVECDALSGVGCTSGRAGGDLSDLESPGLGVDRRIDFVFVVPAGPSASCQGVLDTPDDADGDGIGVRLFAAEPNPFRPCGPAPLDICFVSDHSGIELDLNCPN